MKLEANDILQREQLRTVFSGYVGSGGGTQTCILTWVEAYSGKTKSGSGNHYSAGSAGSSEANNDCVANYKWIKVLF